MKIHFRRWARIPRWTGSLIERSLGFVVESYDLHYTAFGGINGWHLVESHKAFGGINGFYCGNFCHRHRLHPRHPKEDPKGSILFRVPFWPFLTKLLLGTWLCIPSIGFERPHIPPESSSTQENAGDVTHLWTPKPIAKGRFLSPVKSWLENSFPFGFQ